ncbi:alanyl-tRNA editing protein [Lutimaribacter saemankumensis]|uniref:Alanine--tRNA ligase n=1 Tax=Lutimaribacter saemankumensis TaxID=490829 RepID=A0A1G8RTL7_9RHOB|nr:alanyl-tRNA editing protein [Lutimaribacter saemankumensis]SDJ20414.1 misacylated tRNA(Ala) deacylase [Lutimaribacter saemankumensis]
MTDPLFRTDAYLRETPAQVVAITPEGGIVLDGTIFYATGGGQPGDSGRLSWDGGAIDIATSVKTDDGAIALVPSEPGPLPVVGTQVLQQLDWDRRYRHMRIHTALHLLSVVIPLPVSGGAITAEKGRLDFDMPEAPEDRDGIETRLNALVARDLPVTDDWITDDELRANPGLVKTMSVMPPMGQGRVRLVRIGQGDDQVDLQPCGGTHVARTGEIGQLRLGKIEKKGRQNRRVAIHLAD